MRFWLVLVLVDLVHPVGVVSSVVVVVVVVVIGKPSIVVVKVWSVAPWRDVVCWSTWIVVVVIVWPIAVVVAVICRGSVVVVTHSGPSTVSCYMVILIAFEAELSVIFIVFWCARPPPNLSVWCCCVCCCNCVIGIVTDGF